MTFVISEPYIGHLGLGVESMVTAMVPNIRNELAGKEPSDIPKERGFNKFRKFGVGFLLYRTVNTIGA